MKEMHELHIKVLFVSNKNLCNRINTNSCSQKEDLKSDDELAYTKLVTLTSAYQTLYP